MSNTFFTAVFLPYPTLLQFILFNRFEIFLVVCALSRFAVATSRCRGCVHSPSHPLHLFIAFLQTTDGRCLLSPTVFSIAQSYNLNTLFAREFRSSGVITNFFSSAGSFLLPPPLACANASQDVTPPPPLASKPVVGARVRSSFGALIILHHGKIHTDEKNICL